MLFCPWGPMSCNVFRFRSPHGHTRTVFWMKIIRYIEKCTQICVRVWCEIWVRLICTPLSLLLLSSLSVSLPHWWTSASLLPEALTCWVAMTAEVSSSVWFTYLFTYSWERVCVVILQIQYLILDTKQLQQCEIRLFGFFTQAEFDWCVVYRRFEIRCENKRW